MNRRDELVQKMVKKGGFRALVNAKCVDCIYDELAPGSWRKQVGNCTVTDCPLYSVRPTSSTQEA